MFVQSMPARYTTQYSPYIHSSLKFVRQLLNSTLFSAPPFQYTGKSGRALCTEYRAGLAKVLPSHPTEGGKKCCRRSTAASTVRVTQFQSTYGVMAVVRKLLGPAGRGLQLEGHGANLTLPTTSARLFN
ncbi:unnamed protein product [Danaus chrysippus]|uniref:(African queen) hypothetical protein n=1 Tax=Danaus chrysippus TaxID=151541 RepID=A0A8J2RKD4_9NEOP|nr:unnamed protein product [Danaus chrysippus]